MGDPTYKYLASAILTAHQRREDSNCFCGELELGESWSDHVAEILDKVGALRKGPSNAV